MNLTPEYILEQVSGKTSKYCSAECNFFKLNPSYGFKNFRRLRSAAHSYVIQDELSKHNLAPPVSGNLIVNEEASVYGFTTKLVPWIPLRIMMHAFPNDGEGMHAWGGLFQKELFPDSDREDIHNRIRSLGITPSDCHCGNWGIDHDGNIKYIDVGHFILDNPEIEKRINTLIGQHKS